MINKYFFFPLILLLLFSCNNKPPIKTIKKEKIEAYTAYDNIIASFNNRTDLIEANSLTYSNEDVEKDVTLFLDPVDYSKVKMVFTTKKKDFTNKEIMTFYFLNKKKIYSKKTTSTLLNNKTQSIEKISCYDSTGVFNTRERHSMDKEMGFSNYKATTKETHYLKEADEIIGQIGKYETNFKAIIKNEKDYYLIVGENKKNGFHAVLNVFNPDKKFLTLDKNKNIGKKLIIQFDKEKNEDDWFQTLKSFEISND